MALSLTLYIITTDVLITITSKGTEFVVIVTFEGTKTADFVTFKGIFLLYLQPKVICYD